jgi:uracil-DNA glycosylase
MLILPKGSPSSRIWVIAETPLSTDAAKGYMFSGGAGYVFDKMMQDAGIQSYYVIARRPDTEKPEYEQIFDMQFGMHKPPFVIVLGAAGQHFCKELKPQISKDGKERQSYKTPLSKYNGSLLQCAGVWNPHYCMPLQGVEVYLQDWQERQITTYFDLQKLREEYEFWKKNRILQPLPFRQLEYKDMDIQTLFGYLGKFSKSKLLSVDIETCYPKSDSEFYPHPGYPLTIGIADSPSFGISFNLFREDMNETKILWKELASLLSTVPNLGQNYFNFDTHYLEMLGFSINKKTTIDTLIRHHILWPELPHKLQFQTRQYTREIYYKDDGHHWNLKNMEKLRRYNALDVTVTYEIYLQQEEEFALRKSLA